jgi:hypothetical protein
MSGIASHGRLGKTQAIALTTAPATSNPIGPQTFRVRLVSTVACEVTLGDTVNAYLAPNFPEVFLTTPGQTVTAAALTGTGSLNLTELE